MEKFIKYLEILFENDNDQKPTNKDDEGFSYNNIHDECGHLDNNNDALDFLISSFSYFKLFISSFYNFFISFNEYSKYISNQIQIILFTIILTFRLVLSIEINSNISTNLIISAYFYKKNITRITYEKVLENEKNGIKFIQKEEEELIEENKENIFSLNKILISILCFFILFLVIKFTRKKKIKNFICFNLFGIYILLHIVKNLYKDKNYFSSSFMFILLIYFDKNLLDSILIKLGFQRDDLEIFPRNLVAQNVRQFILKLFSLLNILFFSIYYSLFFYNFWMNYLLNYFYILILLSFLGNCIDTITPYHLKPIKYLIFFLVGVLNIFLSKFFLKNFLFKQVKNTSFYSLYLVNDLFSFYCIIFINKYIIFQYKYLNDINNNNENNKIFLLEKNSVWIIFLFICISFGYLGLYFQEYILFIISIYITKKYIEYFSKLYNIKISRILNNIIILNFFSFIQKLEKLDDFYLLYLIKNIINLDKQIIIFSLEFIFLLLLLYNVIITNFFLYIGYEDSNINNNKTKIVNIIYIIIEILIQFLIINIIIKLYKNQEKKLIINILNLFAIIIYHLIKIPSINELKKKNDENLSYNLYIFIWVVISLIIIEISGPEISLLYLVNHINLIFFINFYILNDRNNNIFKIIVIFILLLDYYRLHSWLFIVDALAIIFYPIIKNLKGRGNHKNYEYQNRYRINIESINAYNKLTFSFALFLLLFSLLEII